MTLRYYVALLGHFGFCIAHVLFLGNYLLCAVLLLGKKKRRALRFFPFLTPFPLLCLQWGRAPGPFWGSAVVSFFLFLGSVFLIPQNGHTAHKRGPRFSACEAKKTFKNSALRKSKNFSREKGRIREI